MTTVVNPFSAFVGMASCKDGVTCDRNGENTLLVLPEMLSAQFQWWELTIIKKPGQFCRLTGPRKETTMYVDCSRTDCAEQEPDYQALDTLLYRTHPAPYDIRKHVNEDQKCQSKTNGDGWWGGTRWVVWPCRERDCPRHWRRYAIRRYARIRKRLQPRANAYQFRLSCRRQILPRIRPINPR